MIIAEALDGKVQVRGSICVQIALDLALFQGQVRELLQVTVVGLDLASSDVGLLELITMLVADSSWSLNSSSPDS